MATLSGQDYVGGANASLADFHVLPVIHYPSQIADGQALLGAAPALTAWLERMNLRNSVSSTVPSLG